MKKITYYFSFILLFLAFLSCEEQSEFPDTNSYDSAITIDKKVEVKLSQTVLTKEEISDASCGDPTKVKLIAGQTIEVGEITVSNDATNLYVTYDTSGDWYLSETHLYVGPFDQMPATNKGIPIPGQFPFHGDHGQVQSYTFTIPLDKITKDGDGCFAIVTHAAVINTKTGKGETAFGEGIPFEGPRWGWYFMYCEQECENVLGWLYKTTNPDLYVTCFEDNGMFGFSNEIHYTWLTNAYPNYPIWMQVEDNCGIANVVKVGNIWFSVIDQESVPKIKLEIKMLGDYSISDLGLYVGWTNPVTAGNLNLGLEDIVVHGNSYTYTKEVSSMLGTAPAVANPPFYVITKVDLK